MFGHPLDYLCFTNFDDLRVQAQAEARARGGSRHGRHSFWREAKTVAMAMEVEVKVRLSRQPLGSGGRGVTAGQAEALAPALALCRVLEARRR